MSLSIRRFVACLAAAVLVFAQLAVAAFACPGDLGRAAPVAAMQTMPGCDAMDPAPAPLCASHCVDGAQSFEKPATAGVAPATLVGMIAWQVPVASFHAPIHGARRARGARPPQPPLPIRNCCLRI